ncbi:MAG: glycosyltransferase family 2 protein [Candidatus Auribacterota bacterium]
MNKKIRLSVIVCTYNRGQLIGDSLQSLVAQTLDPALFEVIVIDNNSTDTTAERVQEFTGKYPHFHMIKEMEQGLSNARNRGWKEAKGEYVVYIDDDAKASPNWCERILINYDTVTPTPVVVGGQILPWHECEPPIWFHESFEKASCGDNAKFLQPPLAHTGFSGSNMCFKKSLFTSYGGFSTELGMIGNETRMGEETELFLKIFEHEPYFWYDPQLIVYHWVPSRKMLISYRMLRMYKVGYSDVLLRYNCAVDKKENAPYTFKPMYWRIRHIISSYMKPSLKLLFRFLTHPCRDTKKAFLVSYVRVLQAWSSFLGARKAIKDNKIHCSFILHLDQ